MKVNSVQSLLGIWVAVLGLSSCAASRQRTYDVRPENRAALYQERKASPHYRMDNEHTFPVYKDPYTVKSPEGLMLFDRWYYELTVRRKRLMSRLRTVALRVGGFSMSIQGVPL